MSETPGAKSRAARTVARLALAVQVLLVVGGWLYRATVYWKIPVAPGDPYGLGDVIELLVYFALLGSSALSLGLALVFGLVPKLRNWRSIATLACAGVVALPLFLLVRPHLQRFMQERSPTQPLADQQGRVSELPGLPLRARLPLGARVSKLGDATAVQLRPGARDPHQLTIRSGSGVGAAGQKQAELQRSLPGLGVLHYRVVESDGGSSGTEISLDGGFETSGRSYVVACSDQAEFPSEPSVDWCLRILETLSSHP